MDRIRQLNEGLRNAELQASIAAEAAPEHDVNMAAVQHIYENAQWQAREEMEQKVRELQILSLIHI